MRLVGVHGITIAPYRHEHAVLERRRAHRRRTGLTALVEIADSTDVTVTGLDITGVPHDPARPRARPGSTCTATTARVRIVGNHVHDLGNDNDTLGSFDINAHGIAVYGDDPHAPVTDLAIRDNVVDHLHLGASESVVVNGNVNGWAITGNHIHDNDNIGIDAIGFEPTLTGKYRYTTLNRARQRRDRRQRRRPHPSRAATRRTGRAARARLVQLRRRHLRRRRHAHRHPRQPGQRQRHRDRGRGREPRAAAPTTCWSSHNHVTGSLFTGITTGGYCNGADDCGGVRTGSSHDNTFADNCLRGNNRLDDGSPELLVQYYAYRDTFVHNTITATNTRPRRLRHCSRRLRDGEPQRRQHVPRGRRRAGRRPVRLVGAHVRRLRRLPPGHRPGQSLAVG